MTKTKKVSHFRKTVAAAAEKENNQQNAYGYLNLPKGVSIFKTKTGIMNIDFIPYIVTSEHHMDRNDELEIAVPGTPWYKKPILVHKNMGVNNETVVCPRSEGKPCPICEYRTKLMKEGADKSVTDAFKPTKRNIYIVIDKDSNDQSLQVFDISNFLFQELLNEEMLTDPDYSVFPDLEEGYTLKIRFAEESFQTHKYHKPSRIDFKQRAEAYDEAIMDEAPNLDEIFQLQSYGVLEKLLFDGNTDKPEKEEKQDEKPVSAGRFTKKRPEVIEEVEEEPEEEVKPRRKAVQKPVIEEVEEVEEEEQEEEKPVPAPRRAASNKQASTPVPAKKDAKTAGECPEGYEYGVEVGDYPECENCPLFNDCMKTFENS